MARRRHISRIAVMQTLFALEARGFDDPSTGEERDILNMLEDNMTELKTEAEIDEKFAENVLLGSIEHWEEVQDAIQKYAPQWPLKRMDPVSRALLMAGTFEILFNDDAPAPVVMDECIEIAKEYGSSESSKFVNGVLNAVAKAAKEEDK